MGSGVTHYLTIGRDGAAEIEEKRSRFLCTLTRVEDEADARAVVERLRKQHWDARHTCSAFGSARRRSRSSARTTTASRPVPPGRRCSRCSAAPASPTRSPS